MRTALLLTALLLSGCYSTSSNQGRGLAIKAGVSATSAYVSKKLLKTPWIGPVAVCFAIAGYEYEDTRGLKRWNDGKLGSALDVFSGCAPGFSLSLHLR